MTDLTNDPPRPQARFAQAALPGPLLVMLGCVFGEQAGAQNVARVDQKAG